MSALDAMPGFTFGCDPELFVINEEGVYVSAEGLIPGDKQNPYKVPGGAIQVDGMAAEFNIDPVTNYKDFSANINSVLRHLKAHLPKGYALMPIPSVEFSEKVWEETPDKAKELGCSPDFNAWTGSFNPPPKNVEKPRLRCAGGHIHVGWTEDADITEKAHILNCIELVKQFDWYLGAWSLRQDADAQRRSLYGSAGACRFKPYGVEYRTLSNFWLTSSTKREAVWNRMQHAITDMRTRFMPEYVEEYSRAVKTSTGFDFNKALIESINTSRPDRTLEAHFRFPVVEIGASFKKIGLNSLNSLNTISTMSASALTPMTHAQGQALAQTLAQTLQGQAWAPAPAPEGGTSW